MVISQVISKYTS